jgi:hypothetical protein
VKIAKTDFPAVYILFDDLTTRVSGKCAAVGSLKVAKLDDCDRGIRVAEEVLDFFYDVIFETGLAARSIAGSHLSTYCWGGSPGQEIETAGRTK